MSRKYIKFMPLEAYNGFWGWLYTMLTFFFDLLESIVALLSLGFIRLEISFLAVVWFNKKYKRYMYK